MKKHLLLSLIMSLCAMSAWADTSVTERFSTIEQISAVASDTWVANVCTWSTAYARHRSGATYTDKSGSHTNDDIITVGEDPMYSIWMSAEEDNKRGCIQTTNWEGGIKAVSFRWAQFGAEANDVTLKLEVKVGETIDASADANNLERASNGQNRTTGGIEYSHDFNSTTNDQLSIKNISTGTVDGNKKRRIVVGYVTITPYLLYRNKKCTLNMRTMPATTTFTNNDLINNTTSGAVAYSITDNGGLNVTINEGNGLVTVNDVTQTGDITVQAKWEEVTTTYDLHIIGKDQATASYTPTSKKIYLDGNPNLEIDKGGHDGTISYVSSNTNVVVVEENVLHVLGVGQTTITATLYETSNYAETSASYTLYVRDNSAQIETFKGRTTENVVVNSEDEWAGDLFDWKVLQVRRYPGTDTLWNNPSEQGTWIRTHGTSANYIQSKDVVEGGIKYLTFYWKQIALESNRKLRLAIFAGDTRVASMEREPDDKDQSYCCHEKFLFGANDVMQSNQRLTIKNESYTDADNDGEFDENEITKDKNSRIVIGNIHITPYLLYTEKSATLDTRDGTKTYKNTSLIDNTEGGHISYESSNPKVATVANDGTVTATGFNAGTIIITATWDDEGAGASTSYELTVIVPEVYSNTETFDNITKATANYSTTEISRAGITATWSALLGGFNPGVTSGTQVDHNCARFRAPYDGSSEKAYLQSSIIPGGIKSLSFDYNVGGDESKTNWDIRVLIIQETDTVKKYILTDFVKAVQDQFITVNIPDINISGDFVIRFENHSTRTIEYTSENRGRFLIDNIRWEGLPMALEDDADNSTVIENNAGYKRNVMLADRTIRTGGYNTLCLPFAMSAEQLAESPLAGGKVYKFTNAYLGADNLDIRFEKVNAMEAGKPYLVTVPADVENPVFEGVTINNSTENNTATGANMRFIGSFNQGTMYETGLYVVANSLYRVSNITSGDKTIGACRAYFDVPTGSPALAPSVRMRIVTHTDHATGMKQINQEPQTNGQKVIRDGQLYIIHNGAMYNVQGARVK